MAAAKKTKKTGHKKTPKNVNKGAELTCKTCGLQVRVVNDCDCVEPCDIMCCGEPMVMAC